MSYRPTITSIIVTIELQGGGTDTISIEPDQGTSIFWTEESLNILCAYYEKASKFMTKADGVANFGQKIADEVWSGNQQIQITCEVINKIWNTANEDNKLVPLITKRPDCTMG